MKEKVVVSYLEEDSVTLRLTPETIGGLVAAMSVEQFERFIGGYTSGLYCVADSVVEGHRALIKGWAK